MSHACDRPRRRSLSAAACILLLAFSGCLSVSIKSSFDKDTDFSQFRTYSWGKVSVPKDALYLEDWVRDAVEDELQKKGFHSASSDENADLLVNFGTSVNKRFGATSIPNKGPFRTNYEDEKKTYNETSLVIDFTDAKREKLVWRGWADGFVSDENDRKDYTVVEVVSRILDTFPPGVDG